MPARPALPTTTDTRAHRPNRGLHCCIASPCRYNSLPDCDSGVKRPIGADGQETIQPGTVTTGPLETVDRVCAHGERPGVPPAQVTVRVETRAVRLRTQGRARDDHVSPSCPYSIEASVYRVGKTQRINKCFLTQNMCLYVCEGQVCITDPLNRVRIRPTCEKTLVQVSECLREQGDGYREEAWWPWLRGGRGQSEVDPAAIRQSEVSSPGAEKLRRGARQRDRSRSARSGPRKSRAQRVRFQSRRSWQAIWTSGWQWLACGSRGLGPPPVSWGWRRASRPVGPATGCAGGLGPRARVQAGTATLELQRSGQSRQEGPGGAALQAGARPPENVQDRPFDDLGWPSVHLGPLLWQGAHSSSMADRWGRGRSLAGSQAGSDKVSKEPLLLCRPPA